MRPDFISREQFRAWMKSTEMNKIAMFDGILAGSYVSRMERIGRPIKSKNKMHRLLDIFARAQAEGHRVEPAPNSKYERDALMKSSDELKSEIETLQSRKFELTRELESLGSVTQLNGSAKTLTGTTLLTEEEIAGHGNPLSDCCGVYFLINNGKVAYVGQSVNVHSRIAGHMSSKEFDEFAYVQCDRGSLDILESLYIHTLRPPLNGEQNGTPCVPLRLDRLIKLTAANHHGAY